MGNVKCGILLEDIMHIKRYFLERKEIKEEIAELDNMAKGLHSPSLDTAGGGSSDDSLKKAIYIDKKEKLLKKDELLKDFINLLYRLVITVQNEKVKNYLICILDQNNSLLKTAKELKYKSIEEANRDALEELEKIDQEIIDTILEKREKLIEAL